MKNNYAHMVHLRLRTIVLKRPDRRTPSILPLAVLSANYMCRLIVVISSVLIVALAGDRSCRNCRWFFCKDSPVRFVADTIAGMIFFYAIA